MKSEGHQPHLRRHKLHFEKHQISAYSASPTGFIVSAAHACGVQAGEDQRAKDVHTSNVSSHGENSEKFKTHQSRTTAQRCEWSSTQTCSFHPAEAKHILMELHTQLTFAEQMLNFVRNIAVD